MTSDEFATRLLKEEKVAVVPGTAFGDCGEGFVCVSPTPTPWRDSEEKAPRTVFENAFVKPA